MTFQKIATKRKSAQVAEQIIEAIRSGIYKMGDRLPPERTIAEEMGVSRPSIREALSALQIVGVLESRAGDGTYVVRTPDRHDAVSSLLEEEESPVEALAARRILERAVVQSAALRVNPPARERLAQALDALRRAAEQRDFEAFSAANARFHLEIVRMAGSDMLERTVGPLIDVMQRQLGQELRRREYVLDAAFFDTVFAVHVGVFEALVAGDAATAAEAMDRHFDLIETSLRV